MPTPPGQAWGAPGVEGGGGATYRPQRLVQAAPGWCQGRATRGKGAGPQQGSAYGAPLPACLVQGVCGRRMGQWRVCLWVGEGGGGGAEREGEGACEGAGGGGAGARLSGHTQG